MNKTQFDAVVTREYESWRQACYQQYGESTDDRLHDGLCLIYDKQGYTGMPAKGHLHKVVRKWVYYAASNKVRQWTKDKERNVDVTEHLDELVDEDPKTELITDVKTAVGRQSYERQQMLRALFYEGLTYRELAERMNCSVYHVISEVNIVSEILRGELYDYAPRWYRRGIQALAVA